MPTLEENVNRVKAAKTAIGNAITAKGGTVGANDGLEDFAADIATIPSGGVEFSNSPINFSLTANIDNLDAIVPDGCTSIESDAFENCKGLKTVKISNTVESIGGVAFKGCRNLTSVELPSSVTTVGGMAFLDCQRLEKIYVDKDEGSIANSPWGAPSTTHVIWRTKRYTSAVNEVSSATTLATSVSCTVGDLVIATFVIRGNTYSLSNDWTLLGISDFISSSSLQRTGMAYKIATSTTESITVTQDISDRIYMNLVAITGASIGIFSGFTKNNTDNSITVNKPTGLVVWAVSARSWGSAPIIPWVISPNDNIASISLLSTAPRLLNVLDQSNNNTITFSAQPYSETTPSDITAASLTITGIDNFWYYDD